MGKGTTIDEIINVVIELQKKDFNNLVLFNKVFEWDEIVDFQEPTISQLNMQSWGMFIKNGYSKRILAEIEQYMKEIKKKGNTSIQQLIQFQQDFLQVIYTVLDEKEIQAHKIFDEQIVVDQHKHSLESIDQMLKWCQLVFAKVDIYFKKNDKIDDQIQKVKAYVHANLQQDISREEVAKKLFINPDYLDRLFKKKMDISVSKYIMQERMSYAKILLVETELSISEIANGFGYSNLSNFSTMFKKTESMSPIDYRKTNRKEI